MRSAAIVDNMVLTMFVDSGQAALLSALCGQKLFISPSILDPDDWPITDSAPTSEFLQGMARFAVIGDPESMERYAYRERFVRAPSGLWQPVPVSENTLSLAARFQCREERQRAKAQDPSIKVARTDPGVAECAALAIQYGWRLWSDDSGMVPMLRTLYPNMTVERTCALIARAVNDGLLSYPQGLNLYEVVFKGRLNLHSSAALEWRDHKAWCVLS